MTKPIEVSLDQATKWADESDYSEVSVNYNYELEIARKAAQWGADQELEACCESISQIWELQDVATVGDMLRELRRYRRPRPLSLKEQALVALDDSGSQLDAAHYNILRRAIEALPD
jgi:hypothetical protein